MEILHRHKKNVVELDFQQTLVDFLVEGTIKRFKSVECFELSSGLKAPYLVVDAAVDAVQETVFEPGVIFRALLAKTPFSLRDLDERFTVEDKIEDWCADILEKEVKRRDTGTKKCDAVRSAFIPDPDYKT